MGGELEGGWGLGGVLRRQHLSGDPEGWQGASLTKMWGRGRAGALSWKLAFLVGEVGPRGWQELGAGCGLRTLARGAGTGAV